ncbi:hypothetical protein [Flavisphingomonas formosensis]|uniref:hypothetical protein n=1 Tax=Flavisphingomonas formosensis TaxID=861534 RepID=UPI0012FA878E|nr:hypothetical protein [Sphingomonas formosensis]
MPEFSSVTDAVNALTAQWPRVRVIRSQDHILVTDNDEILYDGPDWGLLFFIQTLQGMTAEEEGRSDELPSQRDRARPEPGASKPT